MLLPAGVMDKMEREFLSHGVIILAQQIRIQYPNVNRALFQTRRKYFAKRRTKLQEPNYRHGFSGRDSEHGLGQLENAEKFETTEETVHTFPYNDDAPRVALMKETA